MYKISKTSTHGRVRAAYQRRRKYWTRVDVPKVIPSQTPRAVCVRVILAAGCIARFAARRGCSEWRRLWRWRPREGQGDAIAAASTTIARRRNPFSLPSDRRPAATAAPPPPPRHRRPAAPAVVTLVDRPSFPSRTPLRLSPPPLITHPLTPRHTYARPAALHPHYIYILTYMYIYIYVLLTILCVHFNPPGFVVAHRPGDARYTCEFRPESKRPAAKFTDTTRAKFFLEGHKRTKAPDPPVFSLATPNLYQSLLTLFLFFAMSISPYD